MQKRKRQTSTSRASEEKSTSATPTQILGCAPKTTRMRCTFASSSGFQQETSTPLGFHAAARKVVASGKKLEADAQRPRASAAGKEASRGEVTPSFVEKRLGALRGRGSELPLPTTRRREGSRLEPGGGAGGTHPRSPSRAVVKAVEIKKEVEMIRDDSSSHQTGRKKPRDMGKTLASGPSSISCGRGEGGKEEERRSRSRSHGRRRRKRRHSSSSSQSKASSRHQSSSSDDNLMALLKKRSMRAPGSACNAVERLSADGIVEEGYEASGLRHQRPKLLTYYQLILKPHLDPRGRDARELAVLARALDLLREGRLAELSDVLAARLLAIAIDTSTRQGWATARHLEVMPDRMPDRM